MLCLCIKKHDIMTYSMYNCCLHTVKRIRIIRTYCKYRHTYIVPRATVTTHKQHQTTRSKTTFFTSQEVRRNVTVSLPRDVIGLAHLIGSPLPAGHVGQSLMTNLSGGTGISYPQLLARGLAGYSLDPTSWV